MKLTGSDTLWWVNSGLAALIVHGGLLLAMQPLAKTRDETDPQTRIVVQTMQQSASPATAQQQALLATPAPADAARPVDEAGRPVTSSESDTAATVDEAQTTETVEDTQSAAQVNDADRAAAASGSERTAISTQQDRVALTNQSETTKARQTEAEAARISRAEAAQMAARPQQDAQRPRRATSASQTAAVAAAERAASNETVAIAVPQVNTTDRAERPTAPDEAIESAEAAERTVPTIAPSATVPEAPRTVLAARRPESSVRPVARATAAPARQVDDVERLSRPTSPAARVTSAAAAPQATTPVEPVTRPSAVTAPDTARVATVTPQSANRVAATSESKPTERARQPQFEFPDNAPKVAPTPLRPARPAGPERLAMAAPTARRPNGATNRAGARMRPARPGGQRLASPKNDSRFDRLLDFLETYEVPGCATVLPTIAPNGEVTLSGFAADPSLWDGFQDGVRDALRVPLNVDGAQVAPEQCRALTFARTSPAYPRFSLGMTLAKTELQSGETLSGTITSIRDRTIHLLVVDDEGTVQKIDGFLQPRLDSMTFRVPLSVTGNAVRTAQMLVAIAVERPLAAVESLRQEKASTFFGVVEAELEQREEVADLAIVSFYLR